MNKKLRVLFLSQTPLIKYGLKCGFDQLGHETSFLDEECNAIWEKSKEEQIDLIMNRVNEFKPNLVFTEGYAGMPLPAIHLELKKLGIPLFCFDIEADCTPGIGEFFLLHSDFVFTTMEEKVPDFISRGYKSDTLLFGCNPEYHKPVLAENRFKHDISLVCRNYSNRYHIMKWFLMDLLKLGKYDIKIYGWLFGDKDREINMLDFLDNYWTECGFNVDLPNEYLSIVVNSSKIIMGCNVPVNSNSHSSMRPFETLASSDNSLMVAHYQKGQYNLFKDYIYHVNNLEEEIMAIDEILSMTDEQRKEKARLARKHVYKHHSYTLRAKQIISKFYELGGLS